MLTTPGASGTGETGRLALPERPPVRMSVRDTGPEPVGGPLDGVGRAGQVQHQRIGVGVAHGFGHPVLVLQQQRVHGPPGDAVQFAARSEQQFGGTGEILHRILQRGGHVGTVDPQRPADHVVVAQAAPTILQIRLQQRCDVTEAFPPLAGRCRAIAAARRTACAATARGRPRAARRREPWRRRWSARRGWTSPCRARRPARCSSDLHRVRRRADLDAGVPQRVPERFGDVAHTCLGLLRRVQQHHVDVAAGREHTARIAAGGHQRPAVGQPYRKALEPRVGLLRQASGEAAAGQVGVADELGAHPLDGGGVDRLHRIRSRPGRTRPCGCARASRRG